MFISIVVPFHNAEEYIENCIGSLLTQYYPQNCYEILMVDNNSADRSEEIVRRYPQIRLLSESKIGAYAARNRGVAESRGEIIAFTDSDCSPTEDWLQRIHETMSDPKALVIQGRLRFGRESTALSILSDYEAEKTAYTFSAETKEIYYGCAGNLAVRRGIFERIGPFLELTRGADVIFVQRVIAAYTCHAVRFSNNICVHHLEVTSVRKWLQKLHLYGQSFQGYSRLVSCRPLSGRERLQILQTTIRRGQYSAGELLLFIMLLTIGVLCYELGRRWPASNAIR